MYGESKADGSQTGTGRLGSRPTCPEPSAAPGVSAVSGLVAKRRHPANIAQCMPVARATRRLTFIPSLYHSSQLEPGSARYAIPGESFRRRGPTLIGLRV